MSFLDKIVAARRAAVDELRTREAELSAAAAAADASRDMRAALAADGMSVIAEIKRRSPSKGDLNTALDPTELARSYERGGARAISVLTEPEFFGGSSADLRAARDATSLPALWKDFVLDRVQIAHARSCGADGVLLIVRMVGDELETLLAEARRYAMCALVEVFDEVDLGRALDVGADVVGVNHRDLETFDEDPTATKRLRSRVPSDVVLVAESAISTRRDIEALQEIGVHAALVGEALVTSPDPEAKLREMLAS